MSVLTTSNRVDYTGDGTTKTFAFSFPIYNLSDLQVWTNDSAMTTNAPEGLALRKLNGADPFDYVQSIVNFPGGVKGGSITFTAAPPTNMKVILLRVLSETQAQEFGNFDKQDAKQAVEQGFDRLVMEVQQLKEQLNQALLLPVETFNADPTLPPVVNPDPTQTLQIGYNSTGTGITVRQIPAGVRNFTFNTLSMANITKFTSPGTYTFTVPTGITTLYFEIGGSSAGGGGGGAWDDVAAHGGSGQRGGDGGYTELYYAGFTPGEILDIVIGAVGVGGTPHVGAACNGCTGNDGTASIATTVFRRAPHAADQLTISGAEGGRGGFDGFPSGVDAPIGVFATPIGGFASGNANFDTASAPGFGYTQYRGQWGGRGGSGGYIVTQREIDLGENLPADLNAPIDATAGENGKSGFVVIHY